jgi:hypothetical protein
MLVGCLLGDAHLETQNGKKTIGFRTQSSHLFVPYAKAFYTFGVKHVPQCLGE